MFRGAPARGASRGGFPHVCGDVPDFERYSFRCTMFSPRMWGCSGGAVVAVTNRLVFPTYVGMFRHAQPCPSRTGGFPHVCGDVPIAGPRRRHHGWFSPRMWGCSDVRGVDVRVPGVFPTYVGMFLSRAELRASSCCFPHVCGDVPRTLPVICSAFVFSPRMWGCSARDALRNIIAGVFPTYVGMFLAFEEDTKQIASFPHVCGDVPRGRFIPRMAIKFSPRMWGCSELGGVGAGGKNVFPTYVGMFRRTTSRSSTRTRFPHVCGDVPSQLAFRAVSAGFSPRMWGCSEGRGGGAQVAGVFPTYVGMFRVSTVGCDWGPRFPHVCGDVPARFIKVSIDRQFSPRMWGCSGGRAAWNRGSPVFPTYVGMFRRGAMASRSGSRFPHVCGDVPARPANGKPFPEFSPRMWGCSGFPGHGHRHPAVFPTYVGMFRDRRGADGAHIGFPHVCGDVPMGRRERKQRKQFSPRMWGCSGLPDHQRHGGRVFPTHVGMFRRLNAAAERLRGFPHACGDVPRTEAGFKAANLFSPRMWGCSGTETMNNPSVSRRKQPPPTEENLVKAREAVKTERVRAQKTNREAENAPSRRGGQGDASFQRRGPETQSPASQRFRVFRGSPLPVPPRRGLAIYDSTTRRLDDARTDFCHTPE